MRTVRARRGARGRRSAQLGLGPEDWLVRNELLGYGRRSAGGPGGDGGRLRCGLGFECFEEALLRGL